MADVHVALWVRLDAKPGKEKEVADFLRSGLAIVAGGAGDDGLVRHPNRAVNLWHLRRFSQRSGPAGHLSGRVAAALMAKAPDLLAKPPAIEKIDVSGRKAAGVDIFSELRDYNFRYLAIEKFDHMRVSHHSRICASNDSMDNNAIFDERYRVIAIDEQNLILRGIRSGDVLTIINADPENPLTAEDYPPGKLIALNDPSTDTQS